MAADSKTPVSRTIRLMTNGPEIACDRVGLVAISVKPDGRLAVRGIGDTPNCAVAAAGSRRHSTARDVARNRRVAGAPIQHDFVGAPPQLLHVAAPLDLLPAVWNRQHDAARLPPDDLLARVGERDADEDPIWGWGLGRALEGDDAKLPGL